MRESETPVPSQPWDVVMERKVELGGAPSVPAFCERLTQMAEGLERAYVELSYDEERDDIALYVVGLRDVTADQASAEERRREAQRQDEIATLKLLAEKYPDILKRSQAGGDGENGGTRMMPAHEYCTEDDCPCFLAGEEAVWRQIGDYLEDAEERIVQIRRDFVERYENRIEGRGAEIDD